MSMSAFEVLGPIMVGPSSSHTAEALRIARVAGLLAPQQLDRVEFVLFNSFSRTHEGHGTDRALVAGILGLDTDDERVRDSFSLADAAGLSFSVTGGGENADVHPNTVLIRMFPREGRAIEVAGESVGSGRIRISSIDGVSVRITGELPTVFVAHRDKPGVLAALTGAIGARGLNIATMRTFRAERGGTAYTVFEADERIGSLLGLVCDPARGMVEYPYHNRNAIGVAAAFLVRPARTRRNHEPRALRRGRGCAGARGTCASREPTRAGAGRTRRMSERLRGLQRLRKDACQSN